jgi:PAS domain S-box-containing protein
MDHQYAALGTLLSEYAPTGKAAEETLHAIVLGDADAIVVETKDGPRVYTLKDANEPYRHLVERMSEAAAIVDQDGTILYCNGRLGAMVGVEGLVGHNFPGLVIREQRDRAERLLAAGAEFQTSAEMTMNSADGMTVRVSAAPMEFDDRLCVALVITPLDDIAALKASEAVARQSEHRFRIALASSPIVVFEQDLNLRYTWIFSPKLGYQAEQVIGKTDAELVEPRYAGPLTAIKRGVIDTGRPVGQEVAVAAPGCPTEYYDLYIEPSRDRDGNIIGVICAATNITEHKAAETELRLAKAEAERAVLARSKFLAAASHDLRQPVQGLTLMMAVLKQHVTTPTVGKAVGMMEDALDGLSGLLTSILDVSRLDAGVVMPQMAAVDVGVLLNRLASEYSLLAAGRGLRLKARSQALIARTDPALLERVVRNLIENAIRYTNEGGILLGARLRGDWVRLDVVDTGIGIPADKQPHIFEEFFQVGNPGRDRNQGLGLGLSIVGRLVRLLGGEVQVNSREGRGTRFSLLLPLSHTLCQPAAAAGSQGVAAGRLLVIEDDPIVQTGLRLLTEGWGYQVDAVASGEAAIGLCSTDGMQFDAIIADHRLGAGMNGTEAAKEVRARVGRPIPTLIVTGDTAPERISEVQASGFGMLHKPVNSEELLSALAQLLRGG